MTDFIIINGQIDYEDCRVYNTLSMAYCMENITGMFGAEKAEQIKSACDNGADFYSIFKAAQFVCLLRFVADRDELSMSFYEFDGTADNALDRQLDQMGNGWTVEQRTKFAQIAHEIINNPPSGPLKVQFVELSLGETLDLVTGL